MVCPAFESADPHLQVPRTPTLYGKTIQLSCRYGYRFNATLNDTSVSSALRSARTYTAACGASCNYNITSAMLPACVLTSCPLPAHSHSISYTSQHNASLSHPSAWAPQHNSSIPRCSPANCSCVTFRSPTQGIIVRPATLSDGQDDGGLNSTSNGSRVEPGCGCRCVEVARVNCSAINCSCKYDASNENLALGWSQVKAQTHSPGGYDCGCRCEVYEHKLAAASPLLHGHTARVECDFGRFVDGSYEEEDALNSTCNRSVEVWCQDGVLEPSVQCAIAVPPHSSGSCPTAPCPLPTFSWYAENGNCSNLSDSRNMSNMTMNGSTTSNITIPDCRLYSDNIKSLLGPHVESWSRMSPPAYGAPVRAQEYELGGFWASGFEYSGVKGFANHLVNISVSCAPGYRAVTTAADGRPLADAVTCGSGGTAQSQQYTATCAHGTWIARHACVVMQCPKYDTYASWDANILAIEPMAPVTYGNGSGVKVICKEGYRPSEVEPAHVENATWQWAECNKDCSYTPTLCRRVTCDNVIPAHSHIVSSQHIVKSENFSSGIDGYRVKATKYEDVFMLECDFGYSPYDGLNPAGKDLINVTCGDGALTPNITCEHILPYRVGTAPCNVSNTFFGDNVAHISVMGVPSYGQNGFWAREAYFHGNTDMVNHQVNVEVECELGFRVASNGSSGAVCSSSRTFPALCSDSVFVFDAVCVPISCAAFEGPDVSYLASYGTVNSHEYIESVLPSMTAMYDGAVNVTCSSNARAMPARESDLPVDACSSPQSFTTFCQDSCDWSSDLACQPIFCAPYTAENVENTSATPAGETVMITCSKGYRAGSSSAKMTTFNVTCLESCNYSSAVDCLPATCGNLTLNGTSPSDFPAVYLEAYNTAYPYSLSPGEAEHGGSITVTCDAGFIVEDTDCAVSSESRQTFEVTCWDGAYQGLKRCAPIQCTAFNYEVAHDANALTWSSTVNGAQKVANTSGYKVELNVTCKPGFRAVSADYVGEVDCSFPSWYVVYCEACGWMNAVNTTCQPVWCAAPR